MFFTTNDELDFSYSIIFLHFFLKINGEIIDVRLKHNEVQVKNQSYCIVNVYKFNYISLIIDFPYMIYSFGKVVIDNSIIKTSSNKNLVTTLWYTRERGREGKTKSLIS